MPTSGNGRQRTQMAETTGKPTNYWQGERVRLRMTEPGDWEVFQAWNDDSEQSRNLYFIHPPTSAEAMRRQAEAASLKTPPPDDNFDFVIVNEGDEIVGCIGIHDCDPRVGTFTYGINTRAGYRRRGYAAEALRLVLRYYFHERRYQKVNAEAYDFNEASIRLHESLGFQREGRRRRVVYTNGRYHDSILFGLTREEFEELESRRQESES